MTGTPQVLSETPGVATDILSDVLGRLHLEGTVLFRADFNEPWAVTTPEACQLTKLLSLRSDRIIPFHIIAAGGCWMDLSGHPPVWLSEGDAILLPHGDSHVLHGRETIVPIEVGELVPEPPWADIILVAHGGAGAGTRIICGFLQCDGLLFHPMLHHLPRILHVGPGSVADAWLAGTIRHTAAEASRPQPGSRSLLSRLAELMFVEILRKHMQSLPPEGIGWFAAVNDDVTGAGLRLLHAAPFEDWTVERLARSVGVSRTVLAGRFKDVLHQPPMQYLAHWRLRLAAHALSSGEMRVKVIAARTGYDSEAAFSRAFKRYAGMSPAAWRRRASAIPPATPTPST
jgi:AraC-like DNA-binding protein